MRENVNGLTCYSLWLRMGRVKVFVLYKFINEIMESIKPIIVVSTPPSDVTNQVTESER